MAVGVGCGGGVARDGACSAPGWPVVCRQPRRREVASTSRLNAPELSAASWLSVRGFDVLARAVNPVASRKEQPTVPRDPLR